MATLDIILLACFIPAIIQGLRKGFISQAVSLVSIFVGIWLAVKCNPEFSDWLTQNFHGDGKLMRILGFAALVLTGIILMRILGKILTKTLDSASLGFANRLVGLVFALLAYALIIGLLASLFDALNGRWSLVEESKLDASEVYVWLRDFAAKVIPDLKEIASSVKVPDISNANV